MTEAYQGLRRKADTCRRLAASIGDRRAAEALLILAREYQNEAEALENRPAEPCLRAG